MRNAEKLRWVRALHAAVYVVMVAATALVFYAGVSGRTVPCLRGCLALVAAEGVAFFGNGMRCPLTDLAKRYGSDRGWPLDAVMPERWARYSFRFFGTACSIGILLLATRWVVGL